MKDRISCIKIFLLLLFLGWNEVTVGVPAKQGVCRKVLPDGTTLSVRIYGDERFHYVTTLDGYVVAQKADGFYYYVDFSAGTSVVSEVRASEQGSRNSGETAALRNFSKGMPAGFRARAKMSGDEREREQKVLQKVFVAKGSPKALVVLVEFQDMKFSVPSPQQAFDNLLNQNGYSANGGTGSARDYYRDNSNGQFDPQFVVVGPYDLGKPMAYYGSNDEFGNEARMPEFVKDACQKAVDNGVSLSQFDTDGDGILDNVFIYYAGYNEAEYGPAESIWPHRASVRANNFRVDGMLLADYACTSELRNNTGTDMAGIGTFCHEFGHVVGLMDAYDTDNDENGGKGQGLYELSLMSQGNYNNNGCTPPCLTAVERSMAGWLEPEELTASGSYRLAPLSENKAYYYTTDAEGEIFVLEYRRQSGWDAHINGEGLLIYQIDRSNEWVNGVKAKDRWTQNTINCVKAHPCMRIIPANGVEIAGYSSPGMFYPGSLNKTEAQPKPWSGIDLGKGLSNISQSSSEISFDFHLAESVKLAGVITDMQGTAQSGVRLVLKPVEEVVARAGVASFVAYARSARSGNVETTTDARGNYTITDLPAGKYVVEAEKEGFARFSTTKDLILADNRLDIQLQTPVEERALKLSHNGDGEIAGALRNSSGSEPLYVAQHWSVEELKEVENHSLKWVDLDVSKAAGLELKVWLDDACVLTKALEHFAYGRLNRIYLGEESVMIPAGKTLKVGVRATGEVNEVEIPMTLAKGGVVSTNGTSWNETEGCMILSAWFVETVWSTGVELEQKELTVGILDTVRLNATVLPADVTNKAVVWSSSDDRIAKVTDKGEVIGVAEGNAVITAKAADGKSEATCQVTVVQDIVQLKDFMIGQREVRLVWNDDEKISDWKIRYKQQKDNNFRVLESDTTFCIVNQLQPGTAYDVEIVAQVGDVETGVLVSRSFTTEKIQEEVAAFSGIRTDWSEGDLYWPVVNNIQKDVRRIVWKLDGKTFVPTRDLVLPAGTHVLRAEVTTNDGVTEILIRKINVQPKAKKDVK